jgi:hypothetical protein
MLAGPKRLDQKVKEQGEEVQTEQYFRNKLRDHLVDCNPILLE